MSRTPRRLAWIGVCASFFCAAFGAAHVLSSPSGGAQYRKALGLVRGDTGAVVCAGINPCLDPAAAHTLVVFFSPRDCAICLYQTAVVDELYRSVPRSRLNVVGVARDLDVEGARRFVRASRISYPIYVDHSRFERLIADGGASRHRKPVLILLDADGKVLDTHVSGTSVRSHHAYSARIAARTAEAR